MTAPLISRGMGGHQSPAAQTTSWLTPPHVIDALGGPGSFDLDPCGFPGHPTAKHAICLPTDGLAAQWFGRVWLNPPYGKETFEWVARLADHGNGVALIFARTETTGFVREVWGRAHGILFLANRLRFGRPDGSVPIANSGAPSVLVAYGHENANQLRHSGLQGSFVTGWTRA
jgi:hypothetical protein